MNDNVIIKVTTHWGTVKVVRHDTVYDVWCDDIMRHPDCTPESAMRALAQYLKIMDYQWEKQEKC